MLRQHLTTAAVPEGSRVEYWQNAASNTVFPLRLQPVDHPDDDRGFHADFHALRAAGARVSVGVLGPVRSETTPAQARARDPQRIHISLLNGGRVRLSSRQGEHSLGAGDLVLQADDEPNVHTYLERVSMLLLSVDVDELSVPVQALRSSMMVPLQTDPLTRSVLRGAVAMLEAGRDPVDEIGARAYLSGVADLVLRTVLGRSPDHTGTADVRRQQVDEVLRRRSHDPHLSAGLVANEIGLSVRRLHQLFADGPGVAEQIRSTRMKQAADLLADPAWSAEPIARVARRCGFVDPSQFARSFRRWAGVTPSQFRAAHDVQTG
ncbi:MAG: helix-turn-helix transcriptional regulator [Mycobacteriaceae bacterium]